MPISLDWDPQARIWTFTVGESFTFDEVAELMKKTDWNDGRLYLWDLRELRSGPDSTSEVRQAVDLMERGKQRWAGTRVAIVVSRDFDFGIARMFGTYAEGAGVDFRILRDVGDALGWLAAPSPP